MESKIPQPRRSGSQDLAKNIRAYNASNPSATTTPVPVVKTQDGRKWPPVDTNYKFRKSTSTPIKGYPIKSETANDKDHWPHVTVRKQHKNVQLQVAAAPVVAETSAPTGGWKDNLYHFSASAEAHQSNIPTSSTTINNDDKPKSASAQPNSSFLLSCATCHTLTNIFALTVLCLGIAALAFATSGSILFYAGTGLVATGMVAMGINFFSQRCSANKQQENEKNHACVI